MLSVAVCRDSTRSSEVCRRASAPSTPTAVALAGAATRRASGLAIGNSVGTGKNGVSAEIIEVKSLDEVDKLGDKVKGKIVFYNRPMDRTKFNTFDAYGGGVDQRGSGASRAAKYGAIAVLVRSMTTELDDYPHTGALNYNPDYPKIPAVSISTNDAEKLAKALNTEGVVKVFIKTMCESLPDVESHNVIGEIKGSEFPNEIIVIGGHLILGTPHRARTTTGREACKAWTF